MSVNSNDASGNSPAGADSYAVAVMLDSNRWTVRDLGAAALGSFDRAVSLLRQMRAEQALFGMINVEDDFFILLRPIPGGVRVVLSDATAALTDDIAADALEAADLDFPDLGDLDDDELDDLDSWPEGDLDMLADVGVSEELLEAICEDEELWASEQLHVIASELGCEGQLARVTGVDVDEVDFDYGSYSDDE